MIKLEGTGSLMETWPGWVEKIMALVKLESSSRPALRALLCNVDSKDDTAYSDGKHAYLYSIIYINLLCAYTYLHMVATFI